MYLGISSHHSAEPVSSFAAAQRELERCSLTPTGRQRKEKPEGFPLSRHSRSVTWVRKLADGSVAFTLYNTDVVVWHPDNSVTVEAYPTVTTAGFTSRFTPAGMSTSATGLIHYCAEPEQSWRGQRVCRGMSPVRFDPVGDGWKPRDEDLEHQPFRYLVLDKAKAREAAKRYPFAEFRTWLEMMAFHNVTIDHARTAQDSDTALEALEARDFRTAAEHLPLMTVNHKAWGGVKGAALGNIETGHRDDYISFGSVDRLRDYLYDDVGAFSEVVALTLSWGELETLDKRLKQLQKAGVNTLRCGF